GQSGSFPVETGYVRMQPGPGTLSRAGLTQHPPAASSCAGRTQLSRYEAAGGRRGDHVLATRAVRRRREPTGSSIAASTWAGDSATAYIPESPSDIASRRPRVTWPAMTMLGVATSSAVWATPA